MKYIEKKAVYKNGTCEECIFANGFEPCTKFAETMSVQWCVDKIGNKKFPYIISLID